MEHIHCNWCTPTKIESFVSVDYMQPYYEQYLAEHQRCSCLQKTVSDLVILCSYIVPGFIGSQLEACVTSDPFKRLFLIWLSLSCSYSPWLYWLPAGSSSDLWSLQLLMLYKWHMGKSVGESTTCTTVPFEWPNVRHQDLQQVTLQYRLCMFCVWM